MKKKLFIIPILITAICTVQIVYSAVLLDRVVATVNDDVITWSELVGTITHDGKEFLASMTGEEREKKIRELERPFLDTMIEMKLQLQEARRMGLDVRNEEIDGAIEEIKSKFNLTEEALMNSLKAGGLTTEDYRTRMADQILLQKVVNFAVRNTIVVSDKEIEQYYEENRQQFYEEEKVRIRQIFFALPEDGSQKDDVETRAQNVMQRIMLGEDFVNLATEFSEDSSREFGGDLGYITRGTALKEIEDEAFSLKAGDVSKPFWSAAGLHIIKVEEKIEGGGLEKARDKIKEILIQRAFELKYHEWRTGLREKAYIEIKL